MTKRIKSWKLKPLNLNLDTQQHRTEQCRMLLTRFCSDNQNQNHDNGNRSNINWIIMIHFTQTHSLTGFWFLSWIIFCDVLVLRFWIWVSKSQISYLKSQIWSLISLISNSKTEKNEWRHCKEHFGAFAPVLLASITYLWGVLRGRPYTATVSWKN